MKSANGALILVLGILGFVGFGIITGLPAWLMGNASLRDIENGVADPSEQGLVNAGRILGIIATVLTIGGICIAILAFAGMFGLFFFVAGGASR